MVAIATVIVIVWCNNCFMQGVIFSDDPLTAFVEFMKCVDPNRMTLYICAGVKCYLNHQVMHSNQRTTTQTKHSLNV